MHSTCSDGERSPLELVELAISHGLTHMSITDHDTISAYATAGDLAKAAGIQLISGLEFNTSGSQGELHILGYGMDVTHVELLSYCKWRENVRKEWSQKIVKKLIGLSYSINWEDCFERANGAVIVRTHIADELVEKGYFETSTEAFNSLLKIGKPAFVERAPFTTKNAIDLIHKCGGLAFIAHPGIYSFPWSVEMLVEEGIDGIEAFYSKHDADETSKWLERAEHYELFVSVGSDFHGENSRNPRMIGTVPYDASLVHSWLDRVSHKEVKVN